MPFVFNKASASASATLDFSTPLISAFAEQSVIPERYPADRYQKMNEDSPFALATVAAPVAEPVKDWAADYYLGGIAKSMVDGKEELFVGIKSKNAQEQFTLFGTEPRNGISVVGIEWCRRFGLGPASRTALRAFERTPAAPKSRRMWTPSNGSSNGPWFMSLAFMTKT